MNNSDEPRDKEKLISTAVKFLRNPNVENTSLSQKKAFLSQKGLTDEDIDKALEIADTVLQHTQTTPSISPVQPALPQPYVNYVNPVEYTAWSRVKDTLSCVFIFGGGTYALYRLYQDVIKPIISPSTTDEDEREIRASIKDTLTTVQATLTTLQTIIEQQKDQIDTIVHTLQTQQSSDNRASFYEKHTIDDIKSEITSLKSLMLNRHQFPPTPSSEPLLPSWQLTNGDDINHHQKGDNSVTIQASKNTKIDPLSSSQIDQDINYD